MEVIQETSENTSFLKKDIVFALMHFTLNSGSFKLLCSNPAAVHSLSGRYSFLRKDVFSDVSCITSIISCSETKILS
jgi:hypothetical protein